MRVYYVTLLVAAAFLASLNAASAASESAPNFPPTSRLLRAYDAVNEDDEQRAINFKTFAGFDKLKKMPGLEKLTNLFKTKLTPGTFMKWAKNGKSPDYVFLKLKLDKSGDKLFSSPDFNVWVAYTRMTSKTNPEKEIFTSLTARYGDVALNKMVQTATKGKGADDISTQLQNMQFKQWEDLNMSGDNVFKILKLDNGLDSLLINPNLNTWVKYVEVSGGMTGSKTPLINTFRAHYDDAALVKMFNAAKKSPETETMASSLEQALISQLRLSRVKNGH